MKLVLYSRQNCSLCDMFADELKTFLTLEKFQDINVETIDVDTDENLKAQFGQDVPVLTINEFIICQHFFDREKMLDSIN